MRHVAAVLAILLWVTNATAVNMTVPDENDPDVAKAAFGALVVAARDSFNARERGRCLQPGPPVSCTDNAACAQGRQCLAPLTTQQYLKLLVNSGVVEELTQQAVSAAKADVQTEVQSVQDTAKSW